nr:unnamed protein product [Callosobruchus analis]
MVDHNNNTGGGRRSYTYEKEIEDVFGKKRNVHPELLLDASAIHMPITLQRKETCIEGNVLGITEKEAWRQVFLVTVVTSCVTSVPVTRNYDSFMYFAPTSSEDGTSPIIAAKRQSDSTSDSSHDIGMDYRVIPLLAESPDSYEYPTPNTLSRKVPQLKTTVVGKSSALDESSSADGGNTAIPTRITQSHGVFQLLIPKSRDYNPLAAESQQLSGDNKEILQTAQTRHYHYYPYVRVRHVSRRRSSQPRYPLSNYEDSYDRFPTVAMPRKRVNLSSKISIRRRKTENVG